MNGGEANDVNRLLRWVLQSSTGSKPEDSALAREAAARLAARAHKTLAAGLLDTEVVAAWPADDAVADGAGREG